MEKDDRFTSVKNLLEILDDHLVVIDVGARWGFQEHWKKLKSVVQLIGFDADDQEIRALNNITGRDDFVPEILGASSGYGSLYLTQEPACSSLYPPDAHLIHRRPGMIDTSLVSTKEVHISTLDDWADKKGVAKVDFIKLDVQGAELDVLKGAEKTLRSVRALEIEVQFNPLYKDVPLFGDVDRFLRQRGFSLWRIKNFSHYHVVGTDKKSTTEETINYDAFPVNFKGRDGQLFWADAFYVRNEIAYDESRSWGTSLRDACIARVLGFEDLFTSSLKKILENCPEDAAQAIKISLGEDILFPWIEKDDNSNSINGSGGIDYELIDKNILHQLETELNTLRAERDQFEHQVSALYNSTSYKMTAPLRITADIIRSIFKK